jgi:TusA-related sulfurtransferase
MRTILDCRGLACSVPVLKIKKTLNTKGLSRIVVTVDNEMDQTYDLL